MSDDEGSISTEVRGHLLIGPNCPEKYNGYTPTMARQLGSAMTYEEDDLRVGVIFGHDHFTAGLDLPNGLGGWPRAGARRMPRRRRTGST